MYAEGTVTNGINVGRFRRGSFAGLLPVKPMVMKYHWDKVNPDCSTNLGMEFFPLIFSEWGLKDLTMTHFPTFVPNDYLYTEYAKTIEGHEKMEKWEIYAHAVNEIIRQEEGLGINSQPTRNKVQYQQFLMGRVNEITVNDKTFYYPHRGYLPNTDD